MSGRIDHCWAACHAGESWVRFGLRAGFCAGAIYVVEMGQPTRVEPDHESCTGSPAEYEAQLAADTARRLAPTRGEVSIGYTVELPEDLVRFGFAESARVTSVLLDSSHGAAGAFGIAALGKRGKP